MRHLLLLAALTATPAAAQPGPPPEGRLFISPSGEPFRGGEGRDAWFARADADHDGALSLAEFRTDAMVFFKILDTHADGKIDGFENSVYETKIAPEITRMSFPGEGGGDRRSPMGGDSEARNIPRGGPGGPRGGGHRAGGPQRGAPREGAARYGLLNEPQPVRGADADLDWKVTAEEWAKAAGRRFAILDAERDGKLTLATLPAPPTGPRPPR